MSVRVDTLKRNAAEVLNYVRTFVDPSFSYGYWHCAHPLSSRIDVGDYIVDFSAKLNFDGPRDAAGMPLLDLSSVPSADGLHRVESPMLVAQWALGWYTTLLSTGSDLARSSFLDAARWLERKCVHEMRANVPVGICYMDFGKAKAVSGMAQGQAISVWTRAYALTGDVSYIQTSVKAFNLMCVDASDGGVLTATGGVPVLEEWSTDPTHPLNGHIFAFLGILDLANATEHDPSSFDPATRARILEAREVHLRSSLELTRMSDCGFWSLYALKSAGIPNFASCFYHRLHVTLLDGLGQRLGSTEFQSLAKKWHAYLHNPLARTTVLPLKLAHTAGRQLAAAWPF